MASTLSRSHTYSHSLSNSAQASGSSSSAYQPRSTRASPALDPRRQKEIEEAKRLLELLTLPSPSPSLSKTLPPNFSPQAKESRVKRKRSSSAESASKRLTPPLTPTLRAFTDNPSNGRMERVESGLRHEVKTSRDATVQDKGKDKEDVAIVDKSGWNTKDWRAAAEKYRQRAHTAKRSGDAHCRPSSTGPPDQLLALLEHTDASLLYLYAYWCDDKAAGRVVVSNWAGSDSLRKYVRGRWEREKGALAGGMLGLCYLVDAVVVYHLAVDQLGSLHQRANTLLTTSPTTSTSSNHPATAAAPAAPNAKSSSTPSPPNSENSPAISPASSASTIPAPTDLLQSLISANGAIQRSHRLLATSKTHLPLKLLRHSFPKTFHAAVTTELVAADAYRVDPDKVDKFAWPIDMAMADPVPHLVCFGRGMVREVAKVQGKTELFK